MSLRKYIFLSICYILLVSGVIYFLQDEFNNPLYQCMSGASPMGFGIKNDALSVVDLFGVCMGFPVYLWIGLIVFVYFLLTLMHFAYFGTRVLLKNKEINKDIEKIKTQLISVALGEPKEAKLKNAELFKVSAFLNELTFTPNIDKSYFFDIKELDYSISLVKDIYKGSFVEKADKTLKIKTDNAIYQRNLFNKFSLDDKFYLEVLKNKSSYTNDVVDFAILRAIENEHFDILKKEIDSLSSSSIRLNEPMVIKLFNGYENSNNLLSEENYFAMLDKVKFSAEQFVHLAKSIKDKIAPEKLIILMEKISNKYEVALKAYTYILLELEMLEPAKEILDELEDKEFDSLKMYLSTKENQLHCDISYFI